MDETQSESDYDLKEDVRKKGRLCLILSIILAASEAMYQRHILLTLSTAILGSKIQLGANDYDKDCLVCFWYSFAEMNTVNLLVH